MRLEQVGQVLNQPKTAVDNENLYFEANINTLIHATEDLGVSRYSVQRTLVFFSTKSSCTRPQRQDFFLLKISILKCEVSRLKTLGFN